MSDAEFNGLIDYLAIFSWIVALVFGLWWWSR